MRKNHGLLLTAVAVLFMLVSGIGAAQADEVTVTIASKKGVGKYLVSSTGKALYYHKKDTVNASACFDKCSEIWPIFCYRTDQVTAGPGLKKENFGSFKRSGSDTQDQLTYKGMPLYEYHEDGPGDTKGHGVNNLWFLVNP